VVHKLPADLRKALIANATALDAWKDITPLARNEFICWVEDAKQQSSSRNPASILEKSSTSLMTGRGSISDRRAASAAA